MITKLLRPAKRAGMTILEVVVVVAVAGVVFSALFTTVETVKTGMAEEKLVRDVVALGEGYILIREIVVGFGKCRGDDVRGPGAEHETEEPLGRHVNVAGKCYTFIERWVGGPQAYRIAIHMVLIAVIWHM